MKLVIEIPEDEYNYIKNGYPDGEDGERYAYMIKRTAIPLKEVFEDIKGEIEEFAKNPDFGDLSVGASAGAVKAIEIINKYNGESEEV